MTRGIPRPCLHPDCGELTLTGHCADHKPKRHRKQLSPRARGYDGSWDRLSREARRRQPWCSHCGHPGSQDNPLSTDHSPEAWRKVQAGKTLTLNDFRDGLLTVLCMNCNNLAGAARGEHVTR